MQTFGYGFDALNRQTSMTDPTGTTNWTYNADSQTTQVASPAGTIGYGYDAAGARTSMTLPGSRTVTYGYDPSGNLTSLTDWQSQQTTFGYDAAGQQTSITRPNGVATNTTYDAAGQITGIEHHTAGSTLQSFSYAYDDAGNRISVLTAAGTESYTFDLLNRLTEVDYPNGDVVTYTHDANGNRLTQTVNGTTRTSTYDAADQLTTLDGTSYSYDANGNLTAAGTDSFSWDWNNQLSSATVNGTTTGYTYDGTGNRVSATTGGTTTPDLWDNSSGLPSLVSDGTNTYLQANGVQSATDASNTTSYALTDALGSVRGLTDASGTLTGTTAYDAFGAVRAQSGSSLALGFTGALTDPTTGFLDLRARDLAPALGRFLSADTVSPNAPGSQGYNLYAYVANNPTTWTDPSGQSISGAVSETWLLLQAAFHIDYYVEPIVEGIALIAYGSPLQKIGGATDLIFTAVACALDAACRNLAFSIDTTVTRYGSAAETGAWTTGVDAMRDWTVTNPSLPRIDSPGSGSTQPPSSGGAQANSGSGDQECQAAAADAASNLSQFGMNAGPTVGLDQHLRGHQPSMSGTGVGSFDRVAWSQRRQLIQQALELGHAHPNVSLEGNATCEVTYQFRSAIGVDGGGRRSRTIGVYVSPGGYIHSAFPIPDNAAGEQWPF